MSENKLPNDASSSIKGTLYQFCVAVDKCFGLKKGEKIIVERYGDVTLTESEQLEIKQYAEPLTDNHLNFWSTVKNWMHESFDETAYVSLFLCTTQQMGEGCLLREWNSLGLVERINILNTIWAASEQRHQSKKQVNKDQPIPTSLAVQRWILDPSRSNKLHRVVERLIISHSHPQMSQLYCEIKEKYAKGILQAKQDDFLEAMLGFIICPKVVITASWEITYEEFAAKVLEATSKYCKETKQFPLKYQKQKSANTEHANKLFVKKILDIEFREAIPTAISDYLFASQTILHELSAYEVPASRYEAFSDSVLAQFVPLHRRASRAALDIVKDSKNFYDDVMMQNPPSFPGFETPPHSFKNGVIHMHTDDASKDLKWKLDES